MGLVLVAELGQSCCRRSLVFLLGGLQRSQGVVPVRLQAVSDQTIVGVDSEIAAPG